MRIGLAGCHRSGHLQADRACMGGDGDEKGNRGLARRKVRAVGDGEGSNPDLQHFFSRLFEQLLFR